MATAVEGQVAPKPEEEQANAQTGVQTLGVLGSKEAGGGAGYQTPAAGGGTDPTVQYRAHGKPNEGTVPGEENVNNAVGYPGKPGYQASTNDPWTGGYVTNNGGFTSGPGLTDLGDSHTFMYSDPRAFLDPNQQNLLNTATNAINNRANWQLGALGPAAQYGGAQISPQMMLGAAKLDTGSDLQYQAGQNAYINRLAEQAAGMGPSVAETSAAQQREANAAQTMAMLGSQRGAGSTATGLRAAQEAMAKGQQEAAATGALGRAQESQAASAQLGGALSGARGQTQTTAQTIAQLQQQTNLANQGQFGQASLQQAQLEQQAALGNRDAINQLMIQQQQAELQAQQMNNQMYAQGAGLYGQFSQQGVANQIAAQQQLAQEQGMLLQVNSGNQAQQWNQLQSLGGAAASGAGALMMMSDRLAKRDVRDAGGKLRSFLDMIGGEE